MVSIESPEEHDFIFKNIDEWVWTGGHYNDSDEKWTWIDGTPLRYDNWFYKQPSVKGSDMCRGVQIFSTLAMSPCQNIKKFICEKEASGPVENSGNSDTGCPAGWKKKFGNCYKGFNEGRNWSEASENCKSFEVRTMRTRTSFYLFMSYD